MKSLKTSKADPKNLPKDLVRFDYHDREDMFDGVSYNKGGGILHMLRNYLETMLFLPDLQIILKPMNTVPEKPIN